WPLGSRRRQCGGVHPVRLQFLQAANHSGLAIVQRIQRVPCGAVRRNVRLPTDPLCPVRVAAEPLSQYRLVLT
ncbi:hypothetical protein, partial [Proteus mirabilis]